MAGFLVRKHSSQISLSERVHRLFPSGELLIIWQKAAISFGRKTS